MQVVKVVEAPLGWAIPANEKFALVEVAKSGTAYFMDPVEDIENQAKRFRTNNAAPDIATAIDEARVWAAANAATVIYVIRPGPNLSL